MPGPKVTLERTPRPTEYDMKLRVEFTAGGSSVVNSRSWHGQDMMRCLRALFGCAADEQVAAITIDNHGITAELKRG